MILQGLPDSLDDSSWPPVDNWAPDFCGDMDLKICRDGTWWHEGKIMSRIQMRRMFARIIRKEAESYFLVTPVEKVGIQVECTRLVITHTELVDDTWWVETAEGFRQPLISCTDFNLTDLQTPSVTWVRNLLARVTSKVLYQWQISALEKGDFENDHLLFNIGKQFVDLGCIQE